MCAIDAQTLNCLCDFTSAIAGVSTPATRRGLQYCRHARHSDPIELNSELIRPVTNGE